MLHAQDVQNPAHDFKSQSGDLFLSPIERHKWQIAKYQADDKPKTDEDGLIETKEQARITFHYGHITGSAGCGVLQGDYKLSDGHLTIHASFLLYGLCMEAGSRQNGKVIRALNRVAQTEQRHDRILLRDKDGKALILLVP